MISIFLIWYRSIDIHIPRYPLYIELTLMEMTEIFLMNNIHVTNCGEDHNILILLQKN
jgi:hypothetical protein